MTRREMIKAIVKKGEDLENENYHSEAGFYFDLSRQIADRDIEFEGQEQLLNYIVEYSW